MTTLQAVFSDFCAFGKGQVGSDMMDSAKFVKVARDCGLLNKKVTTTDIDLIFTQVKEGKEKTINFAAFEQALEMIAAKRGVPFDNLCAAVIKAGGPTTSGTIADNVRFHDDQSTYTGVHTAGGPTTIDHHNVNMETQLHRDSGHDVRGVKTYDDAPAPTGARRTSRTGSTSSPRRQSALSSAGAAAVKGGSPLRRGSSTSTAGMSVDSRRGSAAPGVDSRRGSGVSVSQRKSSTGSAASQAAAAITRLSLSSEGLEGVDKRVAEVFLAFASSVTKSASEMDSSKFTKLCKDCGLFDAKFTKTDGDLLFTKVCQRGGGKKMSLSLFRTYALPMIADAKHVTESEVQDIVAACPGIAMTGTIAQATRFHDDKSTYTGVHQAGGPTHVDDRISLGNLADRSDADVRGVQSSTRRKSSMRGAAAAAKAGS